MKNCAGHYWGCQTHIHPATPPAPAVSSCPRWLGGWAGASGRPHIRDQWSSSDVAQLCHFTRAAEKGL